MRKIGGVLASISMLVLMGLCLPAYAESESFGSDEWQFTVIPYLWASGLEGDVKVGGQQSSIDLSFSDILEDLDFAGMVQIEARKGRVGLFLNPLYMKLSSEEDFAVGSVQFDVDVETSMASVEFGGFYRLAEYIVSDEKGERVLFFDVLGGGRYVYLDSEIDISVLGRGVKTDKTEEWVDPFIGGRARADLTPRWFIHARADIGGFGIGNTSDAAWNALAGFGYQLNERTAILAGYRALSIDYDGGGNFELDVTFSGPVVGVAIEF
jgi:hypothetical protein